MGGRSRSRVAHRHKRVDRQGGAPARRARGGNAHRWCVCHDPLPAGKAGRGRDLHRGVAHHPVCTDLYFGAGEPVHAEGSAAAVEDAAVAGATDHRPGWLRYCVVPAEARGPVDDWRALCRRDHLLLRLGTATERPLLERPGQPTARAGKARTSRRRTPRALEAELATSGSRWGFFPPGSTTPLPMCPASASATKPSGRVTIHPPPRVLSLPRLRGRAGVGALSLSFVPVLLPFGPIPEIVSASV